MATVATATAVTATPFQNFALPSGVAYHFLNCSTFAPANFPAADTPLATPLTGFFAKSAAPLTTFFAPSSFYREPDWMKAPRGPDVSPALRWFPIVTGLQLAADMMLATTAPIGYGHLYAPEHYIDAWIEVTQPPPIDADTVARLKALHAARFH